MELWKCPRCHYETKYKHSIKKHLTRQYECPATHCDTPYVDILDSMFPSETQKTCPYVCDHCSKGFTTRQARWTHKKTCKKANELQNPSQTQASITNNTNAHNSNAHNTNTNSHNNHSHNTTNNIVNNHIHINAFGKEDLSHITKAFLTQSVKRRDKGLVELMRKIHFDRKVPGNRNIRIRNKKKSLIEYHNGKRWIYEDKSKVLNDVMDKGQNMMQDHFDEYNKTIREIAPKYWYDAITDWLTKVKDGKTAEARVALKALHIMILNESDVLDNTDDET